MTYSLDQLSEWKYRNFKNRWSLRNFIQRIFNEHGSDAVSICDGRKTRQSPCRVNIATNLPPHDKANMKKNNFWELKKNPDIQIAPLWIMVILGTVGLK